MKNTIVLIGAGSATFGLGMLGDIFKSQALEGSSLVLHDINPQTLQHVEQLAQQYIQEYRLPYTLSATTSRQDALRDADFCVTSIEVGDRFELWEQDWRIPQQYGCKQIFGENGGPGGLFHALRIIPPILDICEDIQRICPDAYVLNLSNPMSRICLTVKRKYPELKFIGLCHEIAHLPEQLAGILDIPFSELSVKAGGLNHFSVLLDVIYKETGKDAYPDVRKNAAAYFETAPELTETLKVKWDPDRGAAKFRGHRWADRWLIKEILERFGYLPITVDSHFGEYIHWAQDVVDHKAIIEFFNWYKAWSLNYYPEFQLDGTGGVERAVPIIEGIVTDSHHEELAVNVMNDGCITNLSHDMVVEVPAIIDRNGVHGVELGALPKGIVGLLSNQVAVHDLTAEAALTGSRDIVLQALLVDPVIDSLHGAEQMLDLILELQKDYLGYIQ